LTGGDEDVGWQATFSIPARAKVRQNPRMPIFEFNCRACGNHFEHLVLPWWENANELPECPSCHKKDVEKALSICAVSSAATRQTSLQKARVRNSKVVREKETEEFKEMVDHANEHT
jgi:putative FmdB family regulatory protein